MKLKKKSDRIEHKDKFGDQLDVTFIEDTARMYVTTRRPDGSSGPAVQLSRKQALKFADMIYTRFGC